MTRRKPICSRPTCDGAIPAHEKYWDGLCLRHAQAAGLAHNLQPTEEAHHILTDALDNGWRMVDICRATGLAVRTLWSVKGKRTKRVRKATLDALRRLPAQPHGPLIPAGPTRAKVDALRDGGVTLREIADHIGVDHSTMANYATRNIRVPSLVAEQIGQLHAQHVAAPVDGQCARPSCQAMAVAQVGGAGQFCAEHAKVARQVLGLRQAA